MMYQTITVKSQDGICLLTINRPEALNALSGEVIRELNESLVQLEQDPSIRVVIITGAGKAFVAGADIAYMEQLSAEQARSFAADTDAVYEKIRQSAKIYIAAVNGYALGGGCELALACDLCVASQRARFGLPEVSLGILPGGGGTQRLSLRVGVQKAKEMILTGEAIKADEALRIGLVLRLTAPEDLLKEAYDLARRILKNAPLAVSYAKACIQRTQAPVLDTGIAYENLMFSLCFANVEQREGMRAFLEKRQPVFQAGLQEERR